MNTKYKTPILLIEDNPADAHLVEVYMKTSSVKHELHHAESFFEGMEILGTQDIDIVLLDLSLPDISGFKTLSRYLERFSQPGVAGFRGAGCFLQSGGVPFIWREDSS